MEKINAQWIKEAFDPNSKHGKEIIQILKEKRQKDKKHQEYFAEWHKIFSNFYVIEELTPDLYEKHSLLIIIIDIILLHYRAIHKKQEDTSKIDILKRIYTELQIPRYYANLETFGSEIIMMESTMQIPEMDQNIPIDLFSEIYQALITNITRHPQGEFYTHPVLAEIMTNDSYRLAERVLDPACGSGTFLLAVCKRIHESKVSDREKRFAIQNLIGIDVNPLACIMARANLIIYNAHIFENDWLPAIFCANTLFLDEPTLDNRISIHKTLIHSFDLIIGNPPWVVLNGINSKLEQARIKNVGQKLGILLGGKLATSTELTTIFCKKVMESYLNENGSLFFVVPASIANAAQHELFRQFNGCKHIEIWAFDRDVFRIHNLCMKLQKGTSELIERWQIPWKTFQVEFNPLKIELIRNQIYIPSYLKYDPNRKRFQVGRLRASEMPKEDLTRLLANSKPFSNPQGRSSNQSIIHINQPISSINQPISSINQPISFINQPISSVNQSVSSLNHTIPITSSKSGIRQVLNSSPYQKLFRQGASFVPRNLLFVQVVNKNQNTNSVIIQPAEDLVSKKYSTWEFRAYESAEVESEYIFKVAKSTGMIPFYYITEYPVFLPLTKNTNNHFELKLPNHSLALNHYTKLKDLYKLRIKSGATITDLDRRLDYGHALTDPRQSLVPKVIYAGIGSITKAAILTEPDFIDTSIYFYHPNSLEEAYYLLGFLNSPKISEYVKSVGSTGANGSLRNIHKHPFDIPLPRYDPDEATHQHLVRAAQACEKYVQDFAHSLMNKANETKVITLKSIQNRLMRDEQYRHYITELDNALNTMDLVKKEGN